MSEMAPVTTDAAPATEPEIVAQPAEQTVQADEKTEQVEEKKSFTQAELDKIIQKEKGKAEARAERRMLQVYADKLENITKQPVKAESVRDTKPRMDQYASVDDYVESLTDWKLGQKEEAQNAKTYEASRVKLESHTEGLYKDAIKSDANFDRETFDELVTPAMAQAIIDSDVSVKVMVHLSKNPDEMERIAKLTPARQAAEIGKLETNLEKVKVRVSNAPDPINPIGTRSGGGAVSKEKASMEEYKAMRKAEGARWAR